MLHPAPPAATKMARERLGSVVFSGFEGAPHHSSSALTAPPPAASTLIRMPRTPAQGREDTEGGGAILKINKQKTTLSSSSKCGGVGAPPRRRCCLPGRSTQSVVGRIAPLLMETHGIGWAADSISQHALRRARPATTRGLAPALARQRCIRARGGCSHGGARGDGGGNE